MSFPSTQGAPWYFWANGFALQLIVTTVRDDGSVGGYIIEEDGTHNGFTEGNWNDVTKTFRFVHTIHPDPANPDFTEVQTYTGILFDELPTFSGAPLNPLSSPHPYWVFAGKFTSTGGFENPDRARAGMGWIAIAPAV
jgi:hypothetical protein